MARFELFSVSPTESLAVWRTIRRAEREARCAASLKALDEARKLKARPRPCQVIQCAIPWSSESDAKRIIRQSLVTLLQEARFNEQQLVVQCVQRLRLSVSLAPTVPQIRIPQ